MACFVTTRLDDPWQARYKPAVPSHPGDRQGQGPAMDACGHEGPSADAGTRPFVVRPPIPAVRGMPFVFACHQAVHGWPVSDRFGAGP